MEALAHYAATRRVRAKDNFADFDKLRTGHVTCDQFRRVLATTQLSTVVTKEEVDDVIVAYKSPDDSASAGRVHYARFLEDLNAIEADGSARLPSPNRGTFTGTRSTDGGDVMLRAFNEQLVHQLNARGLTLRDSFTDFDRARTGKMTASRFARCMPIKVEEKYVNALIAKYSTTNGDVAYLAWVDEVEALRARMRGDEPLAKVTSSQRMLATGTGTLGAFGTRLASPTRPTLGGDAARLLSQIREQVNQQQVRVREFFKDGDKLRAGTMPAGVFCGVLGRLKLPRMQLTQEALDTLVEAYSVPVKGVNPAAAHERHVHYQRFLRDLEWTPAADGGATMVGSMGGTLHTRQEMGSNDDSKQLEQVIDKVRTAIRTRRINILPTFQDFDRATKGLHSTLGCTRTRFHRALAINGINLSEREVALLEARYEVRRPGEGDADTINYTAFCDDVAMQELLQETAAFADAGAQQLADANAATRAAAKLGGGQSAIAGSGADAAAALRSRGSGTAMSGMLSTTGRPLPHVSLEDAVTVVARQVAERQIRLGEFLRDYDQLRAGHMKRDKLATAFSIARIEVTEAELRTLEAAFPHPSLEDQYLYPHLLEAIDIEGPGGDATIDKIESAKLAPARAVATTDAVAIEAILDRIRMDVDHRSILLPPFFQDYDRHHRGVITAAQFERAIARHRLPVADKDVALLKQYFADPEDPKRFVRCRDFIAAVDATEKARQRDPHPLGSPLRTRTLMSATTTVSVASKANAEIRPAHLDEILTKIQAFVTSRSVRISEFFKDTDPLRHGTCHRTRLAGALDTLGMRITPEDVEGLCAAYAAPKDKTQVDYARFLRDIDGIERQAAMGNRNLVLPTGTITSRALPLGDLDAAQRDVANDPFVQQLIDRIKSSAAARRVTIRGVLRDFDKLRKGRVTQSQFCAAMASVGQRLNPIETQKMVALLDNGKGEVNYNILCRLIDPEDDPQSITA